MPAPRAEDLVPELQDYSPKDSQVSIYSTWRDTPKDVRSASVATSKLETFDVGLQTLEKAAVGVQTEEASRTQKPVELSKKAEAALPAFIKRASKLVVTEFKAVREEHEALEPLTRGAEAQQEDPSLLHALNPFRHLAAASTSSGADSVPMSLASQKKSTAASSASPYSKLVVTSLSWSCTGQTIAASYGRYDIAGWCTDKGVLATWNVGREGVGTSKPDVCIDVDVCLMSCSFHPEHPALIAGGTFNGDVYVWDLSQESDMQRGKSDTLCDMRHQEPICGISWQYSLTEAGKYGNRSHAYRLITLGADGRVLVWTWHKLETPTYAYHLYWPAPGSERKILWGGTCMSFATSQMSITNSKGGGGGGRSNHFMVGTEGGRIFKCAYDVNSMAAKEFKKTLAAGGTIEPKCPIKEDSYEPHAGAVYGMHCSPYQSDLFLSSGADGSIRLYHSLRGTPLMVVEPTSAQLLSVEWSTSRPLVFAAAAGDGHVYMYDLQQSDQLVRPCAVLDASPDGSSVNALSFNGKRSDLFATASGNTVMVWGLPKSLSVMRKGEVATLRKVVACDEISEVLRLAM